MGEGGQTCQSVDQGSNPDTEKLFLALLVKYMLIKNPSFKFCQWPGR